MQRASGHIISGMPWYRYTARFGGMLVLAMASLRGVELPAICLDLLDNIADLHGFL